MLPFCRHSRLSPAEHRPRTRSRISQRLPRTPPACSLHLSSLTGLPAMPNAAARHLCVTLVMLSIHSRLGLARLLVSDRGNCSISSPSHGSMLALTEDMDLVNVHFTAACRVPAARCALDACRIELAINDAPVMSHECSSAETTLEEGDARVLAVRADLGNLDPGLYDLHVRIWCAGVWQAQSSATVVVMYPDVQPDECVPKLIIPVEPETITVTPYFCSVHPTLVLQGFHGAAVPFRAQYFLRKLSFPQFRTHDFVYERIDYAQPAAISEDARQAINISIPCGGNHQLHVELVSRDGTERVVAAGILGTRVKSNIGGKRDAGIRRQATYQRLALLQNLVCSKCEKRNAECGCLLGKQNPTFVALADFTERTIVASASDYRTELKWVVVAPMGGLGNRLIQIVSGLMLALVTGRGLAIDWQGNVDEQTGTKQHSRRSENYFVEANQNR